MKWSTVLSLAISTIALLPSAGAWEVTWHDSDNKSHSRAGHGPSDCIKIDNAEGKVFSIDSQGEKGINMLLFVNSECSGESAGSATANYTKKSSRDLLGFKVVDLPSSYSSEDTTTKKSASHAAITPACTSSTQASSTSSSESAKLSTVQTTTSTPAAATSASGTSSNASPTTSSAASATTSNAAVQPVGSGDSLSKGLMGGILGLTIAQWLI